MLALVAPRAGLGPGLDNEVVGFVEHLAVIGRVGIIEELLAARPAHPAGDEPPARDQIDFRQLFGHTQRMLQYGQGIADQDDLGFVGNTRQDGGFDIHDAAHAEGVAVVLVQHERIKTDLFGIAIFVQKKVIVVGRLFAVKARVGQGKETSVFKHFVFVDPAIRSLRKIAK